VGFLLANFGLVAGGQQWQQGDGVGRGPVADQWGVGTDGIMAKGVEAS